ISRGDLIGYEMVNGSIGRAITHDFEEAGELILNPASNRYGVKIREQVHKFFLDIEKMTPGGGQNRYSSEFLDALTGVAGVGAVYDPDIVKHKDFGAIIRGEINKVADHLNSLSGS